MSKLMAPQWVHLSLSPILAYIFMEDFEETVLSNYHIKLKKGKRFVDDVFLIWTHV